MLCVLCGIKKKKKMKKKCDPGQTRQNRLQSTGQVGRVMWIEIF